MTHALPNVLAACRVSVDTNDASLLAGVAAGLGTKDREAARRADARPAHAHDSRLFFCEQRG